jgi:protein-tyrosine phosphatase
VSDPLRVALVCTGNRFRSPLAAALLAQETDDLPVEIASLGTLELGAEPALPEAVAIGRTYGLDLSTHTSRSLAGADLSEHDLVLGFERKHVMASVVDGKAPIERTFTLPELVALLQEIPEPPLSTEPVERARVRIRHAHSARPRGYRQAPVAELNDPLGLSAPEQREIGRSLAKLVSTLARRLFA